jgi:hypothetical protein
LTLAAANSIASGSPSNLRQICATAAAFAADSSMGGYYSLSALAEEFHRWCLYQCVCRYRERCVGKG